MRGWGERIAGEFDGRLHRSFMAQVHHPVGFQFGTLGAEVAEGDEPKQQEVNAKQRFTNLTAKAGRSKVEDRA